MSNYAEQRERERKQAEENHQNIFVPLVNGIAAQFNGTVEFSKREFGWNDSHAIIKTAEFELYCVAGRYDLRGTDRMAIGGKYKRHVSLRYGEKRQDSMTVTMKKSAAQVASDIRRRILEQVKDYTERTREDQRIEDERAEERDATVEVLKRIEGANVKTWVGGRGEAPPSKTDSVMVSLSAANQNLHVRVTPGGWVEIPSQSIKDANVAAKLLKLMLEVKS